MLDNLLIFFFVVNALFWGLATHHQHCSLASSFGIKKCPPHWVHLIMGFVSFGVAVYLKQANYINPMANSILDVLGN